MAGSGIGADGGSGIRRREAGRRPTSTEEWRKGKGWMDGERWQEGARAWSYA